MKLTSAVLLLLGVLPSLELLAHARAVPLSTLPQSDLDLGPTVQGLHNVSRAAPAPKGPAEAPGGGRAPIEDPNTTPAGFGGRPSGGESSGGPFGGANEPLLGRPGAPGEVPGAPAAPAALRQPVAMRNPPPGLANEFDDFFQHLSPEGTNPLLSDKSILFDSALRAQANTWSNARPAVGYKYLADAMSGFLSMATVTTQADVDLLFKIRSAAFAAASSGEVRAFLPKEGFAFETIFTQWEWPQLVAAESKVTRIIWMEMVARDAYIERVIWTKDKGPVPFQYNTPIGNIRY